MLRRLFADLELLLELPAAETPVGYSCTHRIFKAAAVTPACSDGGRSLGTLNFGVWSIVVYA
jgi:hypothetical protein